MTISRRCSGVNCASKAASARSASSKLSKIRRTFSTHLLYMLSVQTHRYVFSTNDTIRYRFPTHTNDLVMDRSEAETSEAFMVVLEPGEAPPLHQHDDTEQVFYVVRGTG